jgi:hypothetical protein
MKPPLPTLDLQFRRADSTLPELDDQVSELRRFWRAIEADSPLFSSWYLGSDTSQEDALRFKLFGDPGESAAAARELQRRTGKSHDVRTVGLWNGAIGRGEGASLSSKCSILGRPDGFEFSLGLYPEVSDWQVPARWVTSAISIWPTALYATFAPLWHSERRIFQDRPGVGWMIYLPRAITAAQVPEARQLVPVNAPDGSPRGTIVVSVTEGGYSDDNPEHLATAQAIETRLVDLDLLPRFADL